MNEKIIALQTLHAEMRACRLCLEAGYPITPTPIFRGGPEARAMLIGQAPGITEPVAGRPFNAGSGRRLFKWLAEAGWDEEEFRERVYMTAVNKCYPGPNVGGKGDRVPSRAEQALCRPFLEREIRLINPRLMILVGGLAIKLLYPAGARLDEIVGTAAYFPPEALAADPLNFDLSQAETITTLEDLQSHLTQGRQDAKEEPNIPFALSRPCDDPPQGRFVVPLPHPSGASLWPNRPENQALISRAMALLRHIRCNDLF